MARKEKKYHYIYKITCLKNGRYYIGMHSTYNLKDGYMGGGKRIKNSIKKHGKEAHIKEILEYFDNRESLKSREAELINEDLLRDPQCMNLQPGGGGGIINEEHLKKFSKSGVDEFKKRMENPQYYDDFVSKCSQTMKERWKDPEQRNVLRRNIDFTGKTHSEESKKLIGDKKWIIIQG